MQGAGARPCPYKIPCIPEEPFFIDRTRFGRRAGTLGEEAILFVILLGSMSV